MLVAFIDDKEINRIGWQKSMDLIGFDSSELICFNSLDSLIQHINSGKPIDIAFIDFFLGSDYGIDAIKVLRAAYLDKIVLIAHSSMPQANEGMLNNGANFSLPKIKETFPSPTILIEFKSKSQLLDTYKCNYN